MNSLSNKRIFSRRSWFINEENKIIRPISSMKLCGIGRNGGMDYSSCTIEQNDDIKLEMYEIFSSKFYAIVSADAKLMSSNGPIEPSSLYNNIKSGENISLEYYLGESMTADLNYSDHMSSPHSNCYPRDIRSDLLKTKKLKNISLPIKIPRILFAELFIIKRNIENLLNVQLSIIIDNKTFPSEIELMENDSTVCNLLAVTKFIEGHSINLYSEDRQWHPIIDGLIIT